MRLKKIFEPKTIAVIGASDKEGSVGYALFMNLLKEDYKGKITPINNKRDKVHGMKAYNSILDLKERQDLVIIATPAKTVLSIIEDCGKAKVGGVVIISSGFSETGRDGEILSAKIVSVAKKYKIDILGPNCLGFICPSINLNASFANKMAKPGNIAFISQSGALCTSILDWANKNNVGFSKFVSVGEMSDIKFHDLIDYFGQDPDTSSILIYMETLKDARKFMSAARAFSLTKPIIVLKAGRSEEGAKATQSHTGSLAGNDLVFNAAFKRAGIIRVDTATDLFHVAKILSMQPKPLSNKLAIITNAGGPGVLATDSLIYLGGQLANLQETTLNKLNKTMPANWSHSNPIDILGDAGPERFKTALDICLKDINIDGILIILTPQAMTDPSRVAEELVSLAKKSSKTIVASWMGGNDVEEGRRILERGGIPAYRSPEDALSSFIYVYNYSKHLRLLYEKPATIPHAFKPKTNKNKEIIINAIENGRDALNEYESKKFLENYGIPVVKSFIARNIKDVPEIVTNVGFPLVMKILSADILHKTNIGGVKININSEVEAIKVYKKIMSSAKKNCPNAKIDGILIEAMAKKKYELLIGSKKDPIFGPTIVFGMGGVAVEVFKDIVIGLPPLNMALSMRIIEKTKIYKLLKGYRNMPGVDVQAIQFLLYKFAYLISDFPEIKEIDINPFAVDEKGGVVLDAKIVLDKKIAKDDDVIPYSHLVISPYPKQYVKKYKIKNGQTIIIRPIMPEDEFIFVEMFNEISLSSQRHIFFEKIKNISKLMMQRYAHIDYDREISLIAEIYDKGKNKIIGVSRIMNDPYNSSAEFSVVVPDKWQGNGIGKKLTNDIISIANERGIKNIHAKFVGKSNPIIEIFENRGFTVNLSNGHGYAELKLK